MNLKIFGKTQRLKIFDLPSCCIFSIDNVIANMLSKTDMEYIVIYVPSHASALAFAKFSLFSSFLDAKKFSINLFSNETCFFYKIIAKQ